MLDRSCDHATEASRVAPADESRSYEELYVEHAPAARRLALSMVPPDVADDVVAEAFARVLAAIRAGGGPSHAFRGYLLTAVRNLAYDWQRARRRLTVVADLDVQAEDETGASGRMSPGIASAADAQAEARDEARLVTRAFGRLPARWREVLWQLEVEGKAPAAVAPTFGLSANGVSALAMRAREGLRQAYLEEHVGANIPAACRAYATEFGAGARGRLSQRRRAAMQEHLGHCPACQDLFTELTELNSRLGAILTPAALAAASSALGSAKRSAILRAGLTGHWRTWRWHPVTTVTGTAAGIAVAGGMLLAVNVTPLTPAPAHAAAGPVVPVTAPYSSVTGKRKPAGGAPGGGAAVVAARPGSGSPARPGSGSPVGVGSLAAVTAPAGPAGAVPRADSVTGAAAPAQASQTQSTDGLTAASTPGDPSQTITSAAGAAVSDLANTAGNAVAGLAETAGATVTGVTDAASGVVSTATNAVTGVTGTATSAVTGVASTAGTTVAAVGKTVSDVATTAADTATDVAATTTATAATATSTAGSAATATTSAVGAVTNTATSTVGAVVGGI